MVFGWNLKDINFHFDCVPANSGNVCETVDWEPKVKPFAEKIRDHYFEDVFAGRTEEICRKRFLQNWHSWDTRFLSNFTFQDLCRIYWDSCISSKFDELFVHGSTSVRGKEERNEYLEDDQKLLPWRLVAKIKSSLWRYGTGDMDDSSSAWNAMTKAINCISSFDIGLKDFEVRLDATRYYGPRGRSRFSGIRKKKPNGNFVYPAEYEIKECYIDAPLAFQLFYKNKLCVTIGFAISNSDDKPKVVIFQIQGTGGKGNRGLYKFGKSGWFEHCLVKIHQHFSDEMDVYLVDGKDAAERIMNSYGEESRESFKKEFYDKIVKLYGQNLVDCERTENIKCSGCRAYKILCNISSKKHIASKFDENSIAPTLKTLLSDYYDLLAKEEVAERIDYLAWEQKRKKEKIGLNFS